MRLLRLGFVLLAAIFLGPQAHADNRPVVAAAASLQFALTEAADAFAAETGRSVRLSFGSSGNLFRQIQQGAPFEMFLSADEAFVLDLAAKGLTSNGEGDVYATGRLVILVPKDGPVEADGSLAAIPAAIRDGRLKRFAIANPTLAPYGRAAEEALRHAGLWDAVQPRLVTGDNISQAAQFVSSGNAEAGLVSLSLALAPALAARTRYALIAEDWHKPLRQRMALIGEPGEAALLFYAFLQEKTARDIFARYGYAPPGAAM
ncbi:MAG: molybdate ABC transporter substrate-binding protein [Alphaproteobacteria bacterium]|nr:molybdate ABC transporter substrate-binding protein [Alphaproteobacteria bacterium]MDX5417382.1 molybdate ABC transporter substrate-binding protein [Alphaproteobacteria bacterium]MDX5494853.1 molybdate ABC transporter substrate-binding protein [Alphaproteobacteria bacterium]